MELDRPKIICLTPVKNEAWILDRFLQATSLWADKIIVADQGSDDDSVEIASKYEKVILVENKDQNYDEYSRQKLLISEARKIEGDKLLITLDADEFLTNYNLQSQEWKTMLSSPKGTVFRFKWIHVKPNLKEGTEVSFRFPWGFMDDGSNHTGRAIHSPRVPVPEKGKNVELNDIAVLHYGFVLPERNLSKKRWYRCWELLNREGVNSITINRKYQEENLFENCTELNENWLKQYAGEGIDMTSFEKDIVNIEDRSGNIVNWSMYEVYWWDREILEMISKNGANKFKKLDIWTLNWEQLAKIYGYDNPEKFRDPRGLFDKVVMRWTRKNNPPGRLAKRTIEVIFKMLKY